MMKSPINDPFADERVLTKVYMSVKRISRNGVLKLGPEGKELLKKALLALEGVEAELKKRKEGFDL